MMSFACCFYRMSQLLELNVTSVIFSGVEQSYVVVVQRQHTHYTLYSNVLLKRRSEATWLTDGQTDRRTELVYQYHV